MVIFTNLFPNLPTLSRASAPGFFIFRPYMSTPTAKAVDFMVAMAGTAAAELDTLPALPVSEVVEIGPLLYALGALLIKEGAQVLYQLIKTKYAGHLARKDKKAATGPRSGTNPSGHDSPNGKSD